MSCCECECDCWECGEHYEPTPEEKAERERQIAQAAEEREANRWRPAMSALEQVERDLDRATNRMISGLEAALFGPRRIMLFGKAVPEELSAEDALRILNAAEVRAP